MCDDDVSLGTCHRNAPCTVVVVVSSKPPYQYKKAIVTSSPKIVSLHPPWRYINAESSSPSFALAAALRQPSIQPCLDRLERHHARSDPTAPPRLRLPACPASSEPHLNLPTSLNQCALPSCTSPPVFKNKGARYCCDLHRLQHWRMKKRALGPPAGSPTTPTRSRLTLRRGPGRRPRSRSTRRALTTPRSRPQGACQSRPRT